MHKHIVNEADFRTRMLHLDVGICYCGLPRIPNRLRDDSKKEQRTIIMSFRDNTSKIEGEFD
jgi:hypothetical protein